jgi:very-long-chain (3R)-3-hydroxyacyl-CoA dehydratase
MVKIDPENHELTLHLLAYNGISALMWSYILVMTIVSLTDSPTSTRGKAASLVSRVLGTESAPISSFIDRFRGTYNQEDAFKHAPLEWWVKWTQTLAVLEIVHAGLGWVRSPVGTVAAQVASRIWTVWGVVEAVPAVCLNTLPRNRLIGYFIRHTGILYTPP